MNRTKKLFLSLVVISLLGLFSLLYFAIPNLLINTRIGAPKFTTPKTALESKQVSCLSFDDLKLAGLYFQPERDSLHTTVIMLHGIRSSKEYYLAMAHELVRQGISVLLIDHRAHGKSEGDYCTFGVKEKYDVESWINFLTAQYPKNKIGVWGQSLGGAIGLQAMEIDHRIQFGIIESTFSHLKTVGPDYIERMFGVRWAWLNNYLDWRIGNLGNFDTVLANPNAACKNITQPIIIVHGYEDKNIDISHGKQNFEALLTKNKRFIGVKDAGHANVWKKVSQTYFDDVIAFMIEE